MAGALPVRLTSRCSDAARLNTTVFPPMTEGCKRP